MAPATSGPRLRSRTRSVPPTGMGGPSQDKRSIAPGAVFTDRDRERGGRPWVRSDLGGEFGDDADHFEGVAAHTGAALRATSAAIPREPSFALRPSRRSEARMVGGCGGLSCRSVFTAGGEIGDGNGRGPRPRAGKSGPERGVTTPRSQPSGRADDRLEIGG